MGALSRAEIEAALRELPGWSLREGMIVKTFAHRTFPEAILFVSAVAHLAEAADHHPDVDIRYTKVTLALTTHDSGGITARDVALARRVESILGGSKNRG
jgi:4a-hydroxytetrahydrobiopterin dehydratase